MAIGLFFTALVGLLQPAPTADAERARVLTLLQARHELPPKAVFEKAAADPRAHVLAIAADEKAFPPHRHAAMAALRYWPDAAAQRLFRAALTSPRSGEMLRHKVIAFYAAAFGAEALPDLAPLLDDPDPQIRMTAVEAVGGIAGAASEKALRGRLAVEESEPVRERLERWLKGPVRAGATIR